MACKINQELSRLPPNLRKIGKSTALSQGAIESHDDQGFALGFEVTRRKIL